MGQPEGERPIINIAGERVALGPLRRDLVPLYQRWVNDFEIAHNFGQVRPLTEDQEQAWYDRQAAAEQGVTFTVYERATWRPIGTTNLHAIDHRNRTATFGVGIGEADCRGQGYGTEVARLMLDYAFAALGLHSVMLIVYRLQPGRATRLREGRVPRDRTPTPGVLPGWAVVGHRLHGLSRCGVHQPRAGTALHA